MKGIRLIQKSVNRSLPAPATQKRDYELFEIVNPIAHLITGLYWILENVDVRHIASDSKTFDDFQHRYDELIISERNHLRIAERDFILQYAKFIGGDWDGLVGLRFPRDGNDTFEVTQEFIESKAVVYFKWIEAACWELYAPDPQVLLTLQQSFDFGSHIARIKTIAGYSGSRKFICNCQTKRGKYENHLHSFNHNSIVPAFNIHAHRNGCGIYCQRSR
jgi:hypothetical protein